MLFGGEPTVKRTVRGLADPPCTSPLGPAGALGRGNSITYYSEMHVSSESSDEVLWLKRKMYEVTVNTVD